MICQFTDCSFLHFQHMGYPPPQYMRYPPHSLPGTKSLQQDPRTFKRQPLLPHLQQQGGLPPGTEQISPPISDSLLRRQLSAGGSSAAGGVLAQSQQQQQLSPGLYPSAHMSGTADNNAALPLDDFSGEMQGLHTSQQQQPQLQQQQQQQQQQPQQLPVQDPLFSGQNLPKSLSVGQTPGTQGSSPTPGNLSSQTSGVTKPRPTEGLTTDPQGSPPPPPPPPPPPQQAQRSLAAVVAGVGDERGLVLEQAATAGDAAQPSTTDADQSAVPPAKSVEELEREIEELRRLREQTEKDIEAFNVKTLKRVERGDSSDSMLSAASEKSEQLDEASSFLHRAKQALSGQGDLPDDLVDAIVKRPIVKSSKR